MFETFVVSKWTLKELPQKNPPSQFCKCSLRFTAVFIEDGGYINASYIEHYDTHFNQVQNKKYISTQGPLPNTIEHFWQMVAKEVTFHLYKDHK